MTQVNSIFPLEHKIIKLRKNYSDFLPVDQKFDKTDPTKKIWEQKNVFRQSLFEDADRGGAKVCSG